MRSYAKILLLCFVFSGILLLAVLRSEFKAINETEIDERPMIAKISELTGRLKFRLVEHAVWQDAQENQNFFNNSILYYQGNASAKIALLRPQILLSLTKDTKVVIFLDPYCDDIGPDGILLKAISGTIVLKSQSTTWILESGQNYCVHPNGPQPI